MFYGVENGKGKSYYALCIANALINKGYPVLFSTLTNLVSNRIAAMHDKEEEIDVKEYDLVIIDDLGVERDSPIIYEMMYAVIDSRARAKKPLIITTNLTSNELKNDVDKRISSRLYEMCDFVECVGEDRRKKSLIKRHRENASC